MMRIIVCLLVLTGCLRSHDAQVEIRDGECVTCHLPDYQATANPQHAAASFPTTCGDCHSQLAWRPALGGIHPEQAFPIAAGAHRGTACTTCHDLDTGSSTNGANTNCIQCHPSTATLTSSHSGAVGPGGQAYAYQPAVPNFCLTCHPDGRANRHPDDRFPRTRDHAVECASCHDRSAGADTAGANVACLNGGCHSLGEEDDNHEDEDDYFDERGSGANRQFCRRCHPDGRE